MHSPALLGPLRLLPPLGSTCLCMHTCWSHLCLVTRTHSHTLPVPHYPHERAHAHRSVHLELVASIREHSLAPSWVIPLVPFSSFPDTSAPVAFLSPACPACLGGTGRGEADCISPTEKKL